MRKNSGLARILNIKVARRAHAGQTFPLCRHVPFSGPHTAGSPSTYFMKPKGLSVDVADKYVEEVLENDAAWTWNWNGDEMVILLTIVILSVMGSEVAMLVVTNNDVYP